MERWVVLDKYGEMWGRFFDDSEQVALHMLDCEEENPDVAPYTVTRIYTQTELEAEREACAKLCDELDNGENSGDYASAARWCAARIRAR